MDAPPIQYCRTSDGVNIAYWTLGEGLPVVHVYPPVNSHIELEWRSPALRGWYEGLAQRFEVVRYNPRNSGLSDDGITDMSVGAMARDLEAVMRAIGAPRVAIIGSSFMGVVTLHVAHRQPDLVAGLVLIGAFPSAAGSFAGVLRTGVAAGDMDPDFWADTAASMSDPNHQETPGPFAAINRAAVDWDTAAFHARMDAYAEYDAAGLLAEIDTRTLVVHYRERPVPTMAEGRALVTGLPNARLTVREGKAVWWFDEDVSGLRETIEQFLSPLGADTKGGGGTVSRPSSFRTLLFTDLESSTALTQALGDAKAQDILHGHNAAVRAALAAHDGEEVKHTGDGIFAAFGSAVAAVEAALQIQRDLAGAEVRVRIGLNAGEPIAEDDDYFGTAVQLAARVCDRAEPGQVLVSNVVKELCSGKLFQFADQGEATLKGFSEPVRLFVVGEGAL